MKHLPKFFVLVCLASSIAWAGLEIGQAPVKVELQGKLGGHRDKSAWSSEEFKGKVSVVFYVDPDVKDLNNDASEALKNEKFSLEKYQSFGIINMAATWMPNFAISSALKAKQKRYPDSIYVRDYKKVLVEKWGISDNNSNVLAFDKQGRLIFRKDGKLGSEDISELIKAIRKHLDD
jgi:YtfJ family uncharacterized protein